MFDAGSMPVSPCLSDQDQIDTLPIPDDEQIPDDIMKAKLDAELSGILNWALDGLDEFRRIGLADPDIVRAATREYRDSSDVLVDWIEARCEVLDHHC